MSSVLKYDIIKTKILQIVTRQGTKIGLDNQQISEFKRKEDYPNPIEKNGLYNNASKIFQELESKEDYDESWQEASKEMLKLITKEEVVAKLIDAMYNIKRKSIKEN